MFFTGHNKTMCGTVPLVAKICKTLEKVVKMLFLPFYILNINIKYEKSKKLKKKYALFMLD